MILKSFADLPRPKTEREAIMDLINIKHFPPSERRAFVGPHPHDGIVTHSLNASRDATPMVSLVRREPPKPKRYRRFSEI